MPRRQAHPAGRREDHRLVVLAVLLATAAALVIHLGPVSGVGQPSPSALARGTSPTATSRAAGAAAASPSPSGPVAIVPSLGSGPAPSSSPSPTAPPPPMASVPRAAPGPFPGGLLIADRGNGRLLVVNDAGHVVWKFPVAGSLPRGQAFSADDAFISPDGRSIVANDEAHQVIDRIDIATRRVVWQFGTYNGVGSGSRHLNTPDDAYPLANGDIVTADIRNCRILEVSSAKRIVRQWGRTGVCRHDPPRTFDLPNGDTPLPDGGLLVTEIAGSRVIRLAPDGHVVFDVHAPVAYPSDAQLAPDGSIVVVDYSNPGAVVRLSPHGRLLWRWHASSGRSRLDHPSLAVPLADGMIALNDDFRNRVIVIDPRTRRIVWQYGHTDASGRGAGSLSIPDGIDVLPPGIVPGT